MVSRLIGAVVVKELASPFKVLSIDWVNYLTGWPKSRHYLIDILSMSKSSLHGRFSQQGLKHLTLVPRCNKHY